MLFTKFSQSHILTGCNIMSNIGTRESAVALKQFCYWTPERSQFSLSCKLSCESDQSKIELRNIWWSKVWDVQDETKSSEETSTYVRHHYFVCLCWNLLDSISKTLEPGNYGWIIKNGPLNPWDNFPPVLSDFNTKCHRKKICTKNCGCKRISEKRQSSVTVQICENA